MTAKPACPGDGLSAAACSKPGGSNADTWRSESPLQVCYRLLDRPCSSVLRDESSQVDLAEGPPGASHSVLKLSGELAEET